MKNYRFLLLAFIIPLFLSSCKEDFDVNASWKNITVVYGMLDSGQDTVFLRINKAFLGSGNVLEMAKIADSSNYKNKLNVNIDEISPNHTILNTYTLDTMTIDNKQDGLFYNPYQLLYYVPLTVNADNTYKLNISLAGNTITATTPIVKNFSLSKPNAGLRFITFRRGFENTIEWESAKNGKRYELVLRFNFKELMLGNPDTIYRHIDWALGTFKSTTTNGGETMTVKHTNDAFYAFIQDKVPYSDPAKEAEVSERFSNTVEYRIAVAGDDLNTYMEVNEPSNSIVQDRPEFTNLTNAIGLFSTRFLMDREKDIAPESRTEIVNLGIRFVN